MSQVYDEGFINLTSVDGTDVRDLDEGRSKEPDLVRARQYLKRPV